MIQRGIQFKAEKTLPLSFRVPATQVDEIDMEVRRDQRKDRVSLLEPIWNWAWQVYKRVGSIRALLEETSIRKISKRIDRATQEQYFAALEVILERAPDTVIDRLGRELTAQAAKYVERRQ